MELNLSRNELLNSLQLIAGAVERKQTLTILSHVYLEIRPTELSLITTDGEVELVSRIVLDNVRQSFEATLPARKLLDICKVLPDESLLNIYLEDGHATIKAGRSRFTLASLPAKEFPRLEALAGSLEFSLPGSMFRALISNTCFAMAEEDVRYYLNGLLLEVVGQTIKMVATDGHRLALMEDHLSYRVTEDADLRQSIIPRRSSLELLRLLPCDEEPVALTLGEGHLTVDTRSFTFTTKLIDGRYPGYRRVIPTNLARSMVCDREGFKQLLARASILSNEKLRYVYLQFNQGLLRAIANNSDQEEAYDEMEVDYKHDEIEVLFNAPYLVDVLNALDTPQIKMSFSTSDDSVLVGAPDRQNQQYVIMPMRA